MKGQELIPLHEWVMYIHRMTWSERKRDLPIAFNELHPIESKDEIVKKMLGNDVILWNKSIDYSKLLLSQPKLRDFIPCDKDGNPLKRPKSFENWSNNMILPQNTKNSIWYGECKAYKEACERVLWEGWRLERGITNAIMIVNINSGFEFYFRSGIMRHFKTYYNLTGKGLIFKRDL